MCLGRIVAKNDGAEEEVRGRVRRVNGNFFWSCIVWKNKNIFR
jgi:hypothetical protein